MSAEKINEFDQKDDGSNFQFVAFQKAQIELLKEINEGIQQIVNNTKP